MVIMTAKVPKRRLLLIVLLLIAAAVVLALCLRGAGGETEKPAKTGTQGATNEARIAFLESYGWQDRKSTRQNSSHNTTSRMPSSA